MIPALPDQCRAWLTDAVPLTMRPATDCVIYPMALGSHTDLAWYVRFRERLGQLDARIDLPLWPEASSGAPAAVQVSTDMGAADVVAFFDFAADRIESHRAS